MLAVCAGGPVELAIKALPEEGGTCRRAGVWKRGRTRRGPAGDLSPFTNPGSSLGCGRVLCKGTIAEGCMLFGSEALCVWWPCSRHSPGWGQGCVYRAHSAVFPAPMDLSPHP